MSTSGTLSLKVLSPEGLIFKEDNLNTVSIPLADGCPIGIRPGHAPLIAETEQGVIRYRSAGSEGDVHLHAGVVDIRENIITLLTAGKVEKTPNSIAESPSAEYDRLMQTLITQIQIDEETEQSLK